jgi:hypothetical protein
MKMKVKLLRNLGFLIAGLLFFASCEYQYIVPEEVVLPDVVSFQNDIIPIFDSNCNSTGCHTAGHFVVDLTPENAFQDIFAKNMVDTDNPSDSPLYTKLVETGGTHDGRSTPAMQQLILKWIEEGALDN